MTHPITAARATAVQQAFQVTERSLEALVPISKLAPDQLATPESGKAEYLLNCNTDGVPTPAFPGIERLTPQLGASTLPWVVVSEGNILVLRWLAHFIGFRHRAVHLFLDHPDHPDCTFIQIRSLSKYNSPGLFDMAVGGHVDGLNTTEESLNRELGEELGLDANRDLTALVETGTYCIEIPDFQPDYQEIEHTTVYQAALKPEAFGRVRFEDSEVGGLVLFKRAELERWLLQSPERLGGGLRDSLPFYKTSQTAQ